MADEFEEKNHSMGEIENFLQRKFKGKNLLRFLFCLFFFENKYDAWI